MMGVAMPRVKVWTKKKKKKKKKEVKTWKKKKNGERRKKREEEEEEEEVRKERQEEDSKRILKKMAKKRDAVKTQAYPTHSLKMTPPHEDPPQKPASAYPHHTPSPTQATISKHTSACPPSEAPSPTNPAPAAQ